MKNRRYAVVLTTILALVMLAGCSSAKTEETKEETLTTIQAENGVEKESEAETVVGEVADSLTAESETETVAEVEPEPIVYEGIDMESTLPGVEWIETFVGIIDEPKFVVFNDGTNKKVIVEDGQKVSFEESDTIAVYLPDGVSYSKAGGGLVEERSTYEHYCMFTKLNMERLRKENKRLKKAGGAKFFVILDNNGEEQQLNCIISLEE